MTSVVVSKGLSTSAFRVHFSLKFLRKRAAGTVPINNKGSSTESVHRLRGRHQGSERRSVLAMATHAQCLGPGTRVHAPDVPFSPEQTPTCPRSQRLKQTHVSEVEDEDDGGLGPRSSPAGRWP